MLSLFLDILLTKIVYSHLTTSTPSGMSATDFSRLLLARLSIPHSDAKDMICKAHCMSSFELVASAKISEIHITYMCTGG